MKNYNQIDEAFMREARIGLMVLSVLLAVFCYLAFGKFSGWYKPEPLAFQQVDEDLTQQTDADEVLRASPGLPGGMDTQFQSTQPTDSAAAKSPFSTSPKVDGIMTDKTPAFSTSGGQTQTPSVQPPKRVLPLPTRPATDVAKRDGGFQPIRPAVPAQTPGPTDTPIKVEGNDSQLSLFVPRPTSKDSTPGQPNPESAFAAAAKPQPVAQSPQPSGSPPENRGGFVPSRPLTQDSTAKPISPFAGNNSFEGRPPVQPASGVQDLEGAQVSQIPKPSELETPTGSTTPNVQMPVARANQPSSDDGDPSLATSEIRKVTTEAADSFWLISQRVYGDGRYFDALFRYNRDRVESFNEVPAGVEIQCPPKSELQARWPRLCPRRMIETEGGETLFDLAKTYLNQGSRFADIIELNYDVLPRRVRPDSPLKKGMRLELPYPEKATATASNEETSPR